MTNKKDKMNTKELALLCAKIAMENKAGDVLILQMTDLLVITDYFVICNGLSERHTLSIAREIELHLKKQGIRCLGKEGGENGIWTLLDYDDVIIHIYLQQAREYYELEELWADAPRLPLPALA